MKKSEIFCRVLDVVSECTEISKEKILSNSRIAEVVDARCITVYWLRQSGLPVRMIMQLCGFKTKGAVYYHSCLYNERIKIDKYFRNQALCVGQKVVSNGLVTGE